MPQTSRTSSQDALLPNDGYALNIPDFETLPQADFIAIFSMQGSLVARKPFGPVVSIAGLPKGVYELRTYNTNGTSHHIGHFVVK
jgi:hypothetical protein